MVCAKKEKSPERYIWGAQKTATIPLSRILKRRFPNLLFTNLPEVPARAKNKRSGVSVLKVREDITMPCKTCQAGTWKGYSSFNPVLF